MVVNYTDKVKKNESHSLDNKTSNEEVEEKSLQPKNSTPQPLLFTPKTKKEYDMEDYKSQKELIKECFKNSPTIMEEKLKELDDEYCEILKKEKIEEIDMSQFFYQDGEEKNGEPKYKLSIQLIVNYFLEKYNIKTQKKDNDEKIFIFYKGIWICNGDMILKQDIERILEGYSKISIVREIIEKIKRKTFIEFEEFNELPEGKICLLNVVYDLYKQVLEDFNPEYYFKSRFNIKYEPEAKCEDIIKFINDTFYESDIPFIQEFFGFCFLNKYKYKKSLILSGPTNTGKTVFTNIMIKLLGVENISNLSLQELSNGKSFDMLNLKDKYVNIYDDLKSEEIKHTGVFKMLTGGSLINAEYKFGARFSFFNFAKLIFACNSIPSLENDNNDDAYYDKWLPAMCDNQVSNENKVSNFEDVLCTPEAISGLFNWAVIGFKRLVDNNGFSYYKSIEETKKIMTNSSKGLAGFVDYFCLLEPDFRISKADFYELYLAFCEEEGSSHILSRKQLSSRLLNVAPYVRESNSKGVRYWSNIGFNKNSLKTYFKDRYESFGFTKSKVKQQKKVIEE